MEIQVTSPAFKNEGMIPSKYTTDGSDVSPLLKFESVPQDSICLALICDDPDAPMGTFVHWVMWNIKPDTKELSEDVPPDKTLPNGSKQGITSFGRYGYGGPAPPRGTTHRYYFKLYALDTELNLPEKSGKKELLKAMEGHIIAQGQLMGKFKRR